MRNSSQVLERELEQLSGNVMVLSTRVGRGMFSLGEAVVERLATVRGPGASVFHRAIEEFLPGAAMNEDVHRYRRISSRFPFLLHIPYRFPPVYWRKLARERYLSRTDLSALERAIDETRAETIVCISHRPAFWAGCLKEERDLAVDLVGLLGEYGSSLGWRFVPWSSLNTYLSPVPRSALRFALPEHIRFHQIELPAREAFCALAGTPGENDHVLVMCGQWGQGRIDRIVRELLGRCPELRIHTVTGDNSKLEGALQREFGSNTNVTLHGQVESLVPILARCASVVTKPGIATLVEARAAGRKLFLVRGMPVAEDNNARFALEHFDAEWFSAAGFERWYENARPTRTVSSTTSC